MTKTTTTDRVLDGRGEDVLTLAWLQESTVYIDLSSDLRSSAPARLGADGDSDHDAAPVPPRRR